jgi:hypothetical protein
MRATIGGKLMTSDRAARGFVKVGRHFLSKPRVEFWNLVDGL